MKRRMGGSSALDFSFAAPLLPGGTTCLSTEGRSQHLWDGELHKPWPAHKLSLVPSSLL